MPRGSDFEARWTEGAWAEKLILEALNELPDLLAVQFGITDGTAFWSSKEMAARDLPDQTQHGKRPDVLIFRRKKMTSGELSDARQLVLQPDKDAIALARKAVLAIESEFSPYDYKHRLDGYGKELSFTIKDEDLKPLKKWHQYFEVPLGIVQVYFDSSYFLAFQSLLDGIKDGTIKKQIERNYNKPVYYPKMSTGIPFAEFTSGPKIRGDVIRDKYGKYTPLRKVEGGKLKLSPEMRKILVG
jgi:hypothetical protein